MLTMPLWNIRNKLCEATRNSPGLKVLKNVTSSDVVTETMGFKIGNYQIKIPSLLDVSNVIFRKTL